MFTTNRNLRNVVIRPWVYSCLESHDFITFLACVHGDICDKAPSLIGNTNAWAIVQPSQHQQQVVMGPPIVEQPNNMHQSYSLAHTRPRSIIKTAG